LAKHIEASVERRQLGSWLRFDAELAYQAAHTKLLGIIDREIQLLLTGPLSAEELEEVKMGAIADVVSAHEQLMLRGLALALSARDDSIPLYDPNRQIRQIRAVDVAALRRVAAKLLRPDRRLVATMRTNSDAPAQGEVSATSGRLFR
jgi:predicted Zn-dependent peptidase